jgi:hydrogenase nickel incorporation protein HypA/HybF
MHEFALAQAVIDTALQTAGEAGISRITKITVRVGELQGIDADSFAFALQEVLPVTEVPLADAVITVEHEPAQFRCRPCQHTFSPAEARASSGDEESEAIHFVPELAHAFLRCPHCQSPDFEVVTGRGVTLQSVEGDT